MGCGPPGSSVQGILQTRTLEWVVISFSRGSSDPRIELVSLVSPALASILFTTSTTWDRVQSLVWEDATSRETAKPSHCNYWAHVLQVPRATPLKPVRAMRSSPHSSQLQKACAKQRRLSTAKSKTNKKNLILKKVGGWFSIQHNSWKNTYQSTGDKDPYRFRKDKNRSDAKKFSSQNIYLSSRLSNNMMEGLHQK